MRLRVFAQGSTVIALVAGALAAGHATSRKTMLEKQEKNKTENKVYPWQKRKGVAKVTKKDDEKRKVPKI